nr:MULTISPECIES: hypothetical protein [unclassified Bartonella]
MLRFGFYNKLTAKKYDARPYKLLRYL